MSTIKIEFPADRLDIARHFGVALKAMSDKIATPATNTAEAGYADAAFTAFFEKMLENLSIGLDIPIEILRGKALPDTNGAGSDELKDTSTADADIGEAVGSFVADLANGGSNDNGGFNQEELEESANLGKRDLNGVAINAELCANAAKPFYASGKRTGQWKKRQGVGDDEYEGWYADALAKITPKDDGGSTVDTSAAFGGQGQGAEGADAEPAIPHDAGSLMAWVAEMQSAGRITQEMVNAAYTQAELGMVDIFEGPGKTPDVIAGRVGELHNILNGWAQQ